MALVNAGHARDLPHFFCAQVTIEGDEFSLGVQNSIIRLPVLETRSEERLRRQSALHFLLSLVELVPYHLTGMTGKAPFQSGDTKLETPKDPSPTPGDQ